MDPSQSVPPSKYGMSNDEFRENGRRLLDYIVDYSDNIRDRQPLPSVKPGFLKELVPAEAPEDPEPWHRVYADIDRVIMKGLVHHSSPRFHGYLPLTGSNVCTLVSLLESALRSNCSIWNTNPIGTELEMLVMDWMAKALGLPDHFLHGGEGGGVLQTSSSESMLLMLLAARDKKLNESSHLDKFYALSKMVVYASEESHFATERSCMFAMIQLHKIPVSDSNEMTGKSLHEAIEKDKQHGLIPLLVFATLGTTSTCAFDKLEEIGALCSSNGLWLHVDAAYAGAAFICPEFRHHMHGIEFVDSISVNFYKWMLVDLGCSGLWVRQHSYLSEAFMCDAPFLQQDQRDVLMPDFMKWQIHTTKKFNALKLWVVIRIYGIKGIQHHIRQHVSLATMIEKELQANPEFSIPHKAAMGLVCFKLKDQTDNVNRQFLQAILADGRLFLIGSSDKNGFFLRLCVCDENMNEDDVKYSVRVVQEVADNVLRKRNITAKL